MSTSYYDQNAEAFFQDTVAADMGDLQTRFLSYLTPGGAILDAGCGSGRDASAFRKAGFDVTAFDASPEMVRLATAYSGLPVLQMTFEDIAWSKTFDGIWACASLLHVTRADLPRTFERVAEALVRGGVLFSSFKAGAFEREHRGRHFTDLTPSMLVDLVAGAGLSVLELWISSDIRPGRAEEQWVNCIGKRIA